MEINSLILGDINTRGDVKNVIWLMGGHVKNFKTEL